MRNWLIIILVLFVTTIAQADDLKPLVLEDQWGKEQALNSDTKLLIFSHHKDGSGWVKQALIELNVSNMAEKNWLYVANISRMPKLITKIFAIPKMRDYEFSIALLRDDEAVKLWPKKEDFVAIYTLSNLTIESVEYFNTADAVKLYLQGKG